MRVLALLLALTACVTLPPVERTVSPASQGQPYPALIDLSDLLAGATAPSRAAAARSGLAARAARIRRAIPAPVTGDLAQRASRLRDRAAALRAVEI